jgi:hypothetical protein
MVLELAVSQSFSLPLCRSSFVEGLGPRRACVDIVSDALLQHHAVQTRKWLTAVTTELTSTGFTVLAVVDPQMHPPEELHAILGLFDGEFNIHEKGTEKLLRIKRMSNQ